jgi:hypothetical protein
VIQSKLRKATDLPDFEVFGINPVQYAILVLRLDEFFQLVNGSSGWRSNVERNRIAFDKTPDHTICIVGHRKTTDANKSRARALTYSIIS